MNSFSGGTRTSTCHGSKCNLAGIIAGSVIGGILLIAGIAFLIIWCYMRRRRRNSAVTQPFLDRQTTKSDVQDYKTYSYEVLRNGRWSSRYQQYGSWHGPFIMSLNFDPVATTVRGYGSDDVGQFSIDGQCSNQSTNISLIKRYKSGTGNPSENFGHQVTMNLTWNQKTGQFEGQWSVDVSRYRGNGKMELKFQDSGDSYDQKRLE